MGTLPQSPVRGCIIRLTSRYDFKPALYIFLPSKTSTGNMADNPQDNSQGNSDSAATSTGTATTKPVYGIPISGSQAQQLSSSGTKAQARRGKAPRPPTPPKK